MFNRGAFHEGDVPPEGGCSTKGAVFHQGLSTEARRHFVTPSYPSGQSKKLHGRVVLFGGAAGRAVEHRAGDDVKRKMWVSRGSPSDVRCSRVSG